MKHYIKPNLLSKPVKIVLVGAGGNGSRVLEHLICLHKAMVAKGHPYGLDVLLIDADTVSEANIGRQAFYPCDVGSFKALTLVNRANMALGDTVWDAKVERLTPESSALADADIVIGAVDNRSARHAIVSCLANSRSGRAYYLDLGNKSGTGQVVLGEVVSKHESCIDQWLLPHVGDLFPELVNPDLDTAADDTPSCSLAEALEHQSLFVNPAVALWAGNLLWQLFTVGEIESHGCFVNVDFMTVLPIAIEHETWSRYGVKRQTEPTGLA